MQKTQTCLLRELFEPLIIFNSNMKIILTSEFHRVADKLLQQWYLNEKKVAFIQNATDARCDAGEVVHRVEAPKEWYRNNGFQFDIIDLRITQGDKLKETLQHYGYLHIHGWDNAYLYTVCKDSWLFSIIHTLLEKWLVYIGSSAWSLIAWPNTTYSIVTSTTFQSELSREKLESMDFSWFQLHPFYLIPHTGKSDRFQMNIDRLQYCQEHKLSPYLTLADHQAIVLENGKFEFIE